MVQKEWDGGGGGLLMYQTSKFRKLSTTLFVNSQINFLKNNDTPIGERC